MPPDWVAEITGILTIRSARQRRVRDSGEFSRWQGAEFLKLQFANLINGLRLFYAQA
jgi:hypothetical protein